MDPLNANVPILGTKRPVREEPNAPGLVANFDIHDSEIMEIERVLNILRERSGSRVEYDAFDREIKERMAEIGFKVDVHWWTAAGPDGVQLDGVLLPEIHIQDRTGRHDFDHDRKVHEITNDVLGLGDKGVLKFDPAQMQKHDHKH